MKLDVDLNDIGQLTRMESELVRYLDVVRYAKSKFLIQSVTEPAEIKPPSDAAGYSGKADSVIAQFLTGKTGEFTSSEAYKAGEQEKLSRGEIRGALYRLMQGGQLSLKQVGVGRRPTTYTILK